MRYLLLSIILFLTSCATTSSVSNNAELIGMLLGSYVSTSSGLVKGNVLHISDPGSLQSVSAVASGNPTKILLFHNNPEKLSGFAGKQVKISGQLRSEHTEIFHTDFVLSVIEIVEQ